MKVSGMGRTTKVSRIIFRPELSRSPFFPSSSCRVVPVNRFAPPRPLEEIKEARFGTRTRGGEGSACIRTRQNGICEGSRIRVRMNAQLSKLSFQDLSGSGGLDA